MALTDVGEEQARSLSSLSTFAPVHVLTSPRLRARRTAALAGFADAVVEPRLAEWDYGTYEGLTSAEIRAQDPAWTIWTAGGPGGESPADVTERLDGLLLDLRSLLADGPVLCFAHGHVLRALTARWLREPVSDGRLYALDTARWCRLGTEHEVPVIWEWNARGL